MGNTILTGEQVYEVMKSTYPAQNDYYSTNYEDELIELKDFEITTADSFLSLMEKHKQRILEIDAEPIDEEQIKWFKEDAAVENIEEKVKNKFWFAFPAFIRIALELEFGDHYKTYAEKRDDL